MADFVGVEKLTKVMNDFFADMGYDEISCFMSHEFAYYATTEEVSYSILEDELADRGYAEFLRRHFKKVPKCTVFMFSLLHELGHHVTMPYFSKRTRRKAKKTKEIIERRIMKTAKSPEQVIAGQIRYCYLYDERLATEHAVNFLLTEYDKIMKHEEIIMKALSQFFKENDIKND